jgi:hypothetical protein
MKFIIKQTLPLSYLFMIYGVVKILEESVLLFYIGFVLIVFNLILYFNYLFKEIKI